MSVVSICYLYHHCNYRIIIQNSFIVIDIMLFNYIMKLVAQYNLSEENILNLIIIELSVP